MTRAFRTALVTEHVSAGRKRLDEDLLYVDGTGRSYLVPRGFESDGASVPRALWWLYPAFGGQYEPAAWLHDWLYANAEVVRVVGRDGALAPLSRAAADALFLEAMYACGFRRTGARVIYLGVRVGGWRPWTKYRSAAEARLEAV